MAAADKSRSRDEVLRRASDICKDLDGRGLEARQFLEIALALLAETQEPSSPRPLPLRRRSHLP